MARVIEIAASAGRRGPMTRGVASLPLDAQWAEWRTSLGYVDDVADALVLAAVDPAAHAQTFNVGPAEVWSNLEWARRLAGVCGWHGEVEIVPRDRTPEPARTRLAALDLTVPICLDTGLIRRRLGYAEVVALKDALAATVAAETAATA
jgi:nucleoside-diphosphate-sugar epimerase